MRESEKKKKKKKRKPHAPPHPLSSTAKFSSSTQELLQLPPPRGPFDAPHCLQVSFQKRGKQATIERGVAAGGALQGGCNRIALGTGAAKGRVK